MQNDTNPTTTDGRTGSTVYPARRVVYSVNDIKAVMEGDAMTRYFVRLSRMETAHFEIEVEAPDAGAAKLTAIEAYKSGETIECFQVCPDCPCGEIEIREEPKPLGEAVSE